MIEIEIVLTGLAILAFFAFFALRRLLYLWRDMAIREEARLALVAYLEANGYPVDPDFEVIDSDR